MQRSFPVFASLAFALGAAISCADDAPSIASSSPIAAPARVIPRAPPAVVAEAQAPALPAVDVTGRVVDDGEQPIVGRSVVVVDDRGRRADLLTDEEGGFRAAEVAPPYDVLVEGAPPGAVTTPLVFIGLRRADPRLEVFERQGAISLPEPQRVHLSVKLPPCRAGEPGCWVSVVTWSANGGGGTAGSYSQGTDTAVYDVEHDWRSDAIPATETIDVHVLVGDADYTQYAYAQVTQIAAFPGQPTNLGVVVPGPVPSSEPVSVAAGMNGSRDGWDWTLATELEVTRGATIPLRYEGSTRSAMRLPLLSGASWHVGAWVQHPPTPERPWFHRSAQAWSGTLPLATANVALDVPAVPEPLQPPIEGSFSRRARALVWDVHAPALASVVLVDVATGQQRFRAFTSDGELSLRRLEAVGLQRIDQGAQVLDLTTTPGATVDELTDPDPRDGKDRFDVHVAGATTYQRFQFVVTP